MRIFSILTALLVFAALYVFVIERDSVRAAIAQSAPQDAMSTADAEGAEPAKPQMEDHRVSVAVMRSATQPVQNTIVLRGKTEAARKVVVKAETSGVVTTPPLSRGQRVASGDLLCQLDPGTREATLAQAKAAMAEAQLNEKAASTLAQRGFTAEITAAARKASLEAAAASVQQAEKEIERLEIHAPFDGVLETDTAQLGEYLTIGSTCATVMNLEVMKMIGYVPERDIDRLQVGNQAVARLLNGREFAGTVSFIANSADSLTRTFEVNVEIPNPEFAIRDGSTVELTIDLQGEAGHLIPQAALTLNDEGTLGVRLNVDNKARFAPVAILRDSVDGLWVAGLPETAEVIVVGQEFVNDGQDLNVAYMEDITR